MQYIFKRVACHKQDVDDSAVQHEWVIEKARYRATFQKSFDGAGAAAAGAV